MAQAIKSLRLILHRDNTPGHMPFARIPELSLIRKEKGSEISLENLRSDTIEVVNCIVVRYLICGFVIVVGTNDYDIVAGGIIT